jgi:hypothetical protein
VYSTAEIKCDTGMTMGEIGSSETSVSTSTASHPIMHRRQNATSRQKFLFMRSLAILPPSPYFGPFYAILRRVEDSRRINSESGSVRDRISVWNWRWVISYFCKVWPFCFDSYPPLGVFTSTRLKTKQKNGEHTRCTAGKRETRHWGALFRERQ